MPYFCRGCGEMRRGTTCKKWCREKYGDAGAEMVPRLDGMVYINDDGSGIPRWEYRQPNPLGGYRPKMMSGPRPQGWYRALEKMGERVKPLLVGGLPEC